MAERRMPRKLPKEFKKYFWDVDFGKTSFNRYPEFVFERILRYGDTKAVRWLLRTVDWGRLKKYVLLRGDRQLDRISNNFWRTCFGLSPSRKPANPLWPF